MSMSLLLSREPNSHLEIYKREVTEAMRSLREFLVDESDERVIAAQDEPEFSS